MHRLPQYNKACWSSLSAATQGSGKSLAQYSSAPADPLYLAAGRFCSCQGISQLNGGFVTYSLLEAPYKCNVILQALHLSGISSY